MDYLIEFTPSGWRRDLIHMMGCFYTSQITPLNSREWDNDWDTFMCIMDDRKDSEWLDIKELNPLNYMPYVARCFQETTGHHLQGLGQHTRWIRARSYYHWKVTWTSSDAVLISKDYQSLQDQWHIPVSSNTCHRNPINLGPQPLVLLGITGQKDKPPQGVQVNHLQWWVELVMANPGMIKWPVRIPGRMPAREKGLILISRHLVIPSHWDLSWIGRRQ